MPTLKVTALEMWNQAGVNATLFHPYFDAISFAVGVEISADLTADLGNWYGVAFQVIDGATNQVVINSRQRYQLPESWPAWWLTAGNNWGPTTQDYSTAERWGLPWNPPYVFGFRAILTSWDAAGKTIDARDVSDIRWFQIIPVIKYGPPELIPE